MLATADKPEMRDGAAALRLAQRIVALNEHRSPDYLDTLAVQIRSRLDLYRAGHSYREPPGR